MAELREYWRLCVHTDTASAVGGWGSNHARSPKHGRNPTDMFLRRKHLLLHEIYVSA